MSSLHSCPVLSILDDSSETVVFPGAVLDELESLSIEKETVVFFSGDNVRGSRLIRQPPHHRTQRRGRRHSFWGH